MTSRISLVALTSLAAAVVLASLPTACSSGSDSHPPPLDTSAGAAGGPSLAGGGGGNSSTAAAGDSNAGGTDPGDASPSDNGGAVASGRPPPGPSACSETAVWMGSMAVTGIPSGADDVLLSMTSDELDLAFLQGDALYVAHRAQASGSFAPGSPIAIPDGWSAEQGAALSADGKRLILVSADQTLLGELTRSTRDVAFAGAVDQSAFATVNQNAVYSGDIYASPTLSPDDLELFFNSAFQGGASTVVAATRSAGQAWSAATRVISGLLDGTDTTRRLPTGVSADERTLFYFNEDSMKEEARWRDAPTLTSPLSDMVDLGTRRGAQPNAACNRLYSAASTGVVVDQD